jgi:hypothetical protein
MAAAYPEMFDKTGRKVIRYASGEHALVDADFEHWPDAVVVVASDESLSVAAATELGLVTPKPKARSRAVKGPREDRSVAAPSEASGDE